ncbi:DEKNAAC102528 [Brettanomyces naardenensis]|uniref:non-specific serine/threonine protein kinase n=1 Tax=Brettanomyces naardenensis TaxID=13370 RepID=A0A448YK38_BRENA|nr:DEKNAAC102528 [Brettanomyces naardenensis]
MWDMFNFCCPCILDKTPTLRINGVSFEILDLLGEGGFSYVYLVQSKSNNSLYALKKINCPYGNSNLKQAVREVDNYREFQSPYIMRSIESAVVQEADGSKTIYILLPYFDNGSLQDIIDRNSVNNSKMDEGEALRLFIGVCRGLISMHRHQPSKNYHIISSMDQQTIGSYEDDIADAEEENPFLSSEERRERQQRAKKQPQRNIERAPEQQPLIDNTSSIDEQPTDTLNGEDATELTETVSMAHRDIKPGNVMLSKDGTPVLCDLGSCDKARVTVHNRSQAITIQELTNEQCTLAYRSPELVDIKVGDSLSEKVDIWSLGCTLYALLYGSSPFEREETINGANILLAIGSGTYSFPSEPTYSDGIKQLIQFCLVVDPNARPDIEEVLSRALAVQRGNV